MDQFDTDGRSFDCPHCGAQVSIGASFCRECGSDDQTGWSEDAESSPFDCGIDFDYDEFIEREFPGVTPVRTRDSVKRNVAFLIVILTCICLLFLLF
jgi:hypothetical protein